MTSHRRAMLKAGALTAATMTLSAPAFQTVLGQVANSGENDASQEPAKQENSRLPVPGDPAITMFLMFTGDAEAAMKYYVTVFENSKILEMTRYVAGETGQQGTVKMATVSLNGHRLMCIDSPVKHDFTFTPAMSLYVSSGDEEKIARYFEMLSQDGRVLMPLDKYDFSKRFGWVQDQFGVSWQLSAS
jgi:predicted 3-demethylubiquinone-9 3-methyltransferase (glyoxalase superfamily)